MDMAAAHSREGVPPLLNHVNEIRRWAHAWQVCLGAINNSPSPSDDNLAIVARPQSSPTLEVRRMDDNRWGQHFSSHFAPSCAPPSHWNNVCCNLDCVASVVVSIHSITSAMFCAWLACSACACDKISRDRSHRIFSSAAVDVVSEGSQTPTKTDVSRSWGECGSGSNCCFMAVNLIAECMCRMMIRQMDTHSTCLSTSECLHLACSHVLLTDVCATRVRTHVRILVENQRSNH